jgi:N-acetylneuraminic acid mutarotase
MLPGGWAVYNNKLYVFGGLEFLPSIVGHDDIWVYDPTANSWSQLTTHIGLARGYIATELMPDNLIYLAGGSQGGANLTDEVIFEKFNPATNTITRGPDLLIAKSNNSGYNFNNKFYVPGGGYLSVTTDVQVYDPGSNAWSMGPPMPFPVRNYSKGYGLNGSIHAIGGLDAGATTWYDYNQRLSAAPCGTPGTITVTPSRTATPSCGIPLPWQNGPNHTPARQLFQGGIGPDGNFYGVGGQDAANPSMPIAETARYDASANSWQSGPPLPVPVGQLSLGIDAASNSGYVAAGFYGYSGTTPLVTTTLQIFDFTTLSWRFGRSMPGAGVEAAGGAVLNGKFYVIGGDDGVANVLTTNYIYDIATSTWSTGAPLPLPRTNTYATAYNGKVYLMGGADTFQGHPVDNLYVYDPAANSWTDLGSSNSGGLGNYFGISPYGVGKLIVTGGGDQSFVPSNTTRIYDIASRTWSAGPTMSIPRVGHAQATLPDGRVIVYSGLRATTPTTLTDSMEILAPPSPCFSPTPTATATNTRTATATNTNTPATTNTPTSTATTTRTNTPAIPNTRTSTPTATSCAIPFTDVHATDYFYAGVRWLYCSGAISGYGDNTFRPFNNTTRGQMVKIVVLAFGITIYTPATPTFRDVPTTDPFYRYIETAAHGNIVSGYNCGGPGEPCPGVYFRPTALVTRGQLSKIIAVAAAWSLINPPNATFRDVELNSAFYTYIETAYCHQVLSGYDCGGPGEPCPGKYFRAGNNAIRGQIAKMVYNAISNLPCTQPAARAVR